MHFSLRARETMLTIRHGDAVKHPEVAMRWLGLWLDSQSLDGRPPPPEPREHPARPPVECCAEGRQSLCRTDLLSGVEAWYPGTTSPRWRRPSKEGPSRIQQLVRKMSKALKQGIRAILPAWKYRSLSCIEKTAHARPRTPRGKAAQLVWAYRIAGPRTPAGQTHHRGSATAHHQVYQAEVQDQLPPQTFPTRLRTTNKLLANRQRPVLAPRKYSRETQQPLQTASKEDSAKVFDPWPQTIPPLNLIVYSDGSLTKTHRKTEIRWMPGHTKIPGNEQADIPAKAGCA